MALTGLDIYKLLPKTNCKECGFPTCLAFAMKLAQKGTELNKCPYVSEETKAALDAASAPPIRLVTVGTGDRKIEVGNEVVLFRHEKTFYHQPGLVIRVKDNDPKLAEAAAQADAYEVERVGMKLSLNGIAVENASGDAGVFAKAVETVKAKSTLPLILMAEKPAVMEAGLKWPRKDKPLHLRRRTGHLAGHGRAGQEVRLPAGHLGQRRPLGAGHPGGERDQGRRAGHRAGPRRPRPGRAPRPLFTQLRRLALKKNFRLLGYPIIAFASAPTLEEEAILAAEAIAKYAGIVVLDHFDPAVVYPLMTLRQNIYTDPQKPIQVEPKLYEIGAPGARARC